MKNKKLFAILTLVCFMFTLMPVAAFAAGDADAVGATAVNGTSLGEFDQNITVTEGDEVALAVDPTEAGYTFVIVEDDELEATTSASTYVFDEVGTYEVYAVLTSEVSSFIDQAGMKKADKWELIQEKDSFIDDVLTVKVKADSDVEYRIELAYADGTAATAPNTPGSDFILVSTGSTYKYEINIDANDGWSKDGELVATLIKGASEEVKNADLTFTTAGYVDVVTEEGTTTDRGGEVEFDVVSDRAGEYKVIVKYGTKAKTELTVNVQAEQVANVAVETAPKAPVDMEQTVSAHEFGFKFTDANGRAYEPAVGGALDTDAVRVSLIEKPADSNYDNDDFTLVKGEDAGEWYVANANGSVGFDEEGEYTIKVTLKNGKSASMTFDAAEFGEVVGIKYDVYNTPRTVAYGESTAVDKVLAYDAAGVTRSISDVATFSANGAAVADLKEMTTQAGTIYAYLTVENDDDYIGKTITVFAEYEDYVASTVLTVVDRATTISYADTVAEVGVNTEIKGAVVDSEGNRSSIAAYIRGLSGNALVLEKPENAVAVATWSVDGDGNVVLDFLASEEGEYKVQVAVSYDADLTANEKMRFVSGVANITVGAGAGTFEDVVVMSIGANNIVVNSDVKAIPAAPMIKDARTFVPFRALAEAFGADVEWVEATQSVVAELNGVKVVMNIGEEVYTVNGVEKTADVAPFINGASTMVPVRFVAEAFGITVTPIYAEDGSVADVMFAK